VNFLLILAAHILRVNCDEMAGDRSRHLAYEIVEIYHDGEFCSLTTLLSVALIFWPRPNL